MSNGKLICDTNGRNDCNNQLEGIGDLEYLSQAQSTFDKILSAIGKCTNNHDSVKNFHIDISQAGVKVTTTNQPTVLLVKSDISSYDPINNKIILDISQQYDAYIKCIENNDYIGISNLFRKLGSRFAHEYRHYIDSKKTTNYRKFNKDHVAQRSDKLREVLSRIKSFLADEEMAFYSDIDYANNQTEKNARISQH